MGLSPLQHSSSQNLWTAYQAAYDKGRLARDLVLAFTCGECGGPFCRVHGKVIVIAPARTSAGFVQSKQGRVVRIKCYDDEQGGSVESMDTSRLKLVKPTPYSPEEFTKDIRSLFFNDERQGSKTSTQEGVAEQVARIKQQALRGDLRGAQEAIELLFVSFPNDTRVVVEFAHIETKIGNFAQASYLFSQAVYIFEATRNLGHEYVLALQGWASCEAKASSSFRARSLFEESIRAAQKLEEFSDRATVYGLHAWALFEDKLGNWSEARELLQRAACIQPGNAVVHQSRALLEARAHNYTIARFHFRLALRSDKTDPKSWQAWALFEASRKCYKRMRRLFFRAFLADPNDIYTLQAWAHQEALIGSHNARARARKLYQRCITLSPRNLHTWQSWALLEERCGNFRAARVLYEQGLHINPSSVPCLQAYAHMERVCGNLDKARTLLQTARKIDPFNAPALMESGLVEKTLGNAEVAEQFFKRARQVDGQKSRVRRLRFLSRKNLRLESKKNTV